MARQWVHMDRSEKHIWTTKVFMVGPEYFSGPIYFIILI